MQNPLVKVPHFRPPVFPTPTTRSTFTIAILPNQQRAIEVRIILHRSGMTRAVFLKPGSISLLVKKLLELGKEEQVFAGITPHQAVHLFAGKMVCLVDYVDRKLATCHYDPLKTYILSCDQVYPYLYLYLSIYIYIYIYFILIYIYSVL